MNPNIAKFELYDAMVSYLLVNGWTREEEGSGWWWKNGCRDEATIGGAVEQQFDADGLDTRKSITGEPQDYWG